jgi:nucleoid-associated protein YgaU
MNNKTLIWTLIVAVPVGVAALVAGYIYSDTGRLPFQDSPATAVAPAPSGDAAQPAASATAPSESQNQTAGGSPALSTADRISATFDVVGVEPTGETVVAGRSEAGAIVALTANGKVIGKSIANEAGEWTIILDEPLKPGDYDVGLEVHDENGTPIATSEQRVAVSLPEGGKEQPLIVLNSPEGPSDILQKPAGVQQVAEASPAALATAGEEQVASAAPAAPNASQEAPAASDEQSAAATTSGQTGTPAPEASVSGSAPAATTEAPAAAPAGTQSAGSATATAETPSDTPSTETQVATAQPQSATAPSSPTGTATATAPQDAAPEDAAAAFASQSAPAATPDGQNGTATTAPVITAEASSAAPAAAAPEADPATPTVTVEAVESEQNKVYVAGTGAPGSSVRVYVGDEFQGEAKVDQGGKWLVQGSKNIAEGNVEVRADLIGSDGNAVDARAAVTFEKEQDNQIVLTKVVATGAGAGPDGQGAAVEKALPVVIIRKGDNLWRISRRLYGHGVRYTTIYQANQEQIRNPDLIYPGQVFLTPEGDLNWKPLPENNG